MEQYPNITAPNLIEETITMKNGPKQFFTVGRKICTISARKLHSNYNESYNRDVLKRNKEPGTVWAPKLGLGKKIYNVFLVVRYHLTNCVVFNW